MTVRYTPSAVRTARLPQPCTDICSPLNIGRRRQRTIIPCLEAPAWKMMIIPNAFFWNQGKFQKTIPIHPATNTALFCTASSTNSYCAFVADCSSTSGYSTHIHATILTPLQLSHSWLRQIWLWKMMGKLYTYKQTHQMLTLSPLLPQSNWTIQHDLGWKNILLQCVWYAWN